MELDLPQTAHKAPSGGKYRLNRRLLVTFPLILVVFVLLFLFKSEISSLLTFQKTDIGYFKLDSIEFSDERAKDQTYQKLSDALTLKNKTEAETSLIQGYFLLNSEYDTRPQESIHESMKLVRDYTQKSHPGVGEILTQELPCKQESCGYKIEIEDNIEALRAEIFLSKSISDAVKDVLRINFEDYTVAVNQNNKEQQFSQLQSVFSNLRSSLNDQNREVATDFIEKTLGIMEQNHPEFFKETEEKGFFKY
jgi:hypothetical protein